MYAWTEVIMENFNNMYHKFNLSVTYVIRGEDERNILKQTVLDTLLKSSVQIQKRKKDMIGKKPVTI